MPPFLLLGVMVVLVVLAELTMEEPFTPLLPMKPIMPPVLPPVLVALLVMEEPPNSPPIPVATNPVPPTIVVVVVAVP